MRKSKNAHPRKNTPNPAKSPRNSTLRLGRHAHAGRGHVSPRQPLHSHASAAMTHARLALMRSSASFRNSRLLFFRFGVGANFSRIAGNCGGVAVRVMPRMPVVARALHAAFPACHHPIAWVSPLQFDRSASITYALHRGENFATLYRGEKLATV